MKLPVETKPAIWGVIGGAIAMAIVGFTWGGWVTSARAESDAMQRSNAAVVAALAPVCAQRFNAAPAAANNLVELKKVDSWSRSDFVEKGGWATLPGKDAADKQSAIARACAEILTGA
jgi:hypothetical protein